MKRKKTFFAAVLFLPVLLTGILLFTGDCIVSVAAEKRLYESIEDVPTRKVGLLLGTSKYLKEGSLNPFFVYRMNAAAALYRAEKIRYIVASGDNRRHSYNEPKIMKEFLKKKGVPSSAIYLDFAGFRTLDSVVRCNRIFGQERFTVVSQKFHNERALFIAGHYGFDVIGFNARDVAPSASIATRIREVFARARAFLDLYIIGTEPYFLGEKIKLPE